MSTLQEMIDSKLKAGVVPCYACGHGQHGPMCSAAPRCDCQNDCNEQQATDEWLKTHLPADMLHIRSEQKDGFVRFVAWMNGRPVGQMDITVMPLVHDMEIDEGMMQRKVAEALFQYASGYTRASGFTEALVLIADTNEKMQRYVEARSAPEEPSKAYLMEIK